MFTKWVQVFLRTGCKKMLKQLFWNGGSKSHLIDILASSHAGHKFEYWVIVMNVWWWWACPCGGSTGQLRGGGGEYHSGKMSVPNEGTGRWLDCRMIVECGRSRCGKGEVCDCSRRGLEKEGSRMRVPVDTLPHACALIDPLFNDLKPFALKHYINKLILTEDRYSNIE